MAQPQRPWPLYCLCGKAEGAKFLIFILLLSILVHVHHGSPCLRSIIDSQQLGSHAKGMPPPYGPETSYSRHRHLLPPAPPATDRRQVAKYYMYAEVLLAVWPFIS